jgi:hypothetical protein
MVFAGLCGAVLALMLLPLFQTADNGPETAQAGAPASTIPGSALVPPRDELRQLRDDLASLRSAAGNPRDVNTGAADLPARLAKVEAQVATLLARESAASAGAERVRPLTQGDLARAPEVLVSRQGRDKFDRDFQAAQGYRESHVQGAFAPFEAAFDLHAVDCRSSVCRISYSDASEPGSEERDQLVDAIAGELGARDYNVYYETDGTGNQVMFIESL